MTAYWAAHALLPTGLAADVRFDIDDGRFTAVLPGQPEGDAHRLPGVVLPGLANCHSHAFHRALRGRTHTGGGTFWTWRDGMYDVAAQLDPDSYLRLARATYAEMALAGITSVGEFHYLHHAPGGRPYDDPNAMGEALRQAARDAGVRLTLLDTCYLAGGLTDDGHEPLNPEQLRFGDGDVEAWADRMRALREDDNTRIGSAIHSVRAVPSEAVTTVVAATGDRPLHAHLSEQRAENDTCVRYYGVTPTRLLHDGGALTARTTAVHATHLTQDDIALLGEAKTTACFCPTTERDLADGIGPARRLSDAGAPLSLGSDQHAVIDLFEEVRALEMHERLMSHERGRFTLTGLHHALVAHGSLAWPDAGALARGMRADLVVVATDSARTAGSDPAQIVYSATSADVHTVIRDGEMVVEDGRHVLGDVGTLLAEAIDPLWEGLA
ncbi:formimidoylglutamate deiminase [Allobranchiibius sp. GilTou38]|uniref:formimidoylglutamate deiminase n=1 Tax=Allobranchiibius sp. GilTou38 TaxID=2815210 RepID=UPI001AA1AD24|nr:formimidoylglutamate deiminase [Allobranchiibius sp. GilTou38]MBO1767214.1 formimidoylglutamate deiminase [Allobranchiibius sp. GilTou38]